MGAPALTNPISSPENLPSQMSAPPAQPAAPAQPAPAGGPAGIQTGPPPQPQQQQPAVPAVQAPVPTPPPAQQAPPQQQQPAPPAQQAPTPTDPADPGFPANTPIAEMTVAQQAAYWKFQARKHENTVKAQGDYADLKAKAEEYQKLVAASQTEHERAVAEARRQGHAEALQSAGGQLVEQWIRAAASGRLPEDSVNALLEGVDRNRFLAPGGAGVDTDRVYAFVNSLIPAAAAPQQVPVPAPAPITQPVSGYVPAPSGGPDFGQGQAPSTRPAGLAAGREIARQRFGKAPSPTQ